MATEFAHSVRSEELELAIPLLPRRGRVLELGAGDGWQARELASRGFAVSAVDVTPAPPDRAHFPVAGYDGRSLPFPTASFDAVYSSNVLEHVADLDFVQQELARVLRPGGVAVHCVPSAVWRFWTSVGHPLYAARWALKLAQTKWGGRKAGDAANEMPAQARGRAVTDLLRLGLVPPRHGEHGNVLSELWLFSGPGWKQRFRRTNWEIDEVRATGLFYTGNELLGFRLGKHSRRRLSVVLGSSTVIYVLRREAARSLKRELGP